MNSRKCVINISRLLVFIMLFSIFTYTPVPAAAAGEEPSIELNDLIAQAEALKTGNPEFPLQVSQSVYGAVYGSDVNQAFPWVHVDELQALNDALEFARNVNTPTDEAIASLKEAIMNFTKNIKSDGSDPYFRLDPGPGKVPVKVTAPTNTWTARTPLDNRVPADFAGGTFKTIPYPFADAQGKAEVLQINYAHNGKSTFGGISLESPLSPSVNVTDGSTIEFDVYYPKSAQGKYMRWRVRNTNTNLDSYLRDYQYNNLNPDWVGSYNGESWLKAHHSITASTGVSSSFILELHGENARPEETGMLLVANIQITAPDPNGVALPDVVNKEHQSAVAPLKSVYNKENGLFMVGAIGTGPVTGTRANHYEIFVDGNNLKADGTHPRGPEWLKSVTGEALNGATTAPGLAEYSFPTNAYQAIRDSGTPGQYKSHGHVLAWYNQAPGWMTQMIPANLASGYNGGTDFYGLGNGVTTTVKVDKEMARRVQFNHTMYVMRHFLTTDTKYGSSESRGVIPFNSWDVLNEEVHESRHSELIPGDANSWRTSLKHTNWLAAMSDDQIGGDITDHYVYLLFKNAHIAAPNAKMAEAYKANYANLPEYMKLDGHDNEGSIDAYIVDNPPKLTYNDYGLATRSKARTVYNMVLELNTAWRSDPLYDGRPLIEDIGIQGHDAVGKTLASDNQYAMALYASLVDRGLLSGITYSELDLKVPTDAPGGGATAPAVLNVRQSDALGYQYALLYKMFNKFAPYIDHIISWGVSGSGWQGSYVLFDGQSNANAGYYGAMKPDRFILGHSYLDDYFAGEYQTIGNNAIDLGDLGVYTPNSVNADLSSLTLSAGTLQPAFNAATTEYDVSLKDADSITVTAAAADSRSTIKVNDTVVASGTASEAIALTPGTKTDIKVEVTGADGRVKTYTLKVTNSKTETPSTPEPGTPSATPDPGTSATPAPGTYSTSAPAASATPAAPVVQGQKVTMQATVNNGTAFVKVLDLAKAKEFMEKNVTLDIPAAQGVNSYSVGLPAAALTSGTKDDKLTISTEFGQVVISGNLLTGTTESSGKEVALEIGKGDKAKLPAEVKTALGDRPIIQLSLKVDGKETAWNNPDARVTVSVPYKPSADELKNPEMIVVWYIDGSGDVLTVPSGRYAPKTGMVTFTTTHFSSYAVAYVSRTFTDLGTAVWAKNAVEVLASKDILKTEGHVFNPSTGITRADFLYSLVRALGLNARVNGNFSDVQKSTYYYNEIAIAKALGITNGIDNDRFGSAYKITRQDMMVLTERALKLEKKLSNQAEAADLERFTDKSEVASYAVNSVAAMVKEGLIEGSGNKVNPTGNTTKAEAAVFLYRLYNK
ncbi:S-layer homology domain-containing protein [Paenibacillus graminis]|uniref:S-layer homology domain-containing protein n=1 Tax=Paenibacillus graminis TaxID=189425 RepID=UPI002DBF479A|nr:S-layer homology domain-containing protein [Paenibacillus graminis]MEC0169101.1 S-layer homology domain-containing protein [Paenibacillus graminis]